MLQCSNMLIFLPSKLFSLVTIFALMTKVAGNKGCKLQSEGKDSECFVVYCVCIVLLSTWEGDNKERIVYSQAWLRMFLMCVCVCVWCVCVRACMMLQFINVDVVSSLVTCEILALMHTHTHTHTHTLTHTHMHVFAHTLHTYYMHTHTHTHTHACICTHTHNSHKHIHACMHTWSHLHEPNKQGKNWTEQKLQDNHRYSLSLTKTFSVSACLEPHVSVRTHKITHIHTRTHTSITPLNAEQEYLSSRAPYSWSCP